MRFGNDDKFATVDLNGTENGYGLQNKKTTIFADILTILWKLHHHNIIILISCFSNRVCSYSIVVPFKTK